MEIGGNENNGQVAALVFSDSFSVPRHPCSVADPFHPKAVRTSMGSLFRIPTIRYRESETLLEDLAGLEFAKVGAASAGGDPLSGAARTEAPLAIFLGGEAFGLPTGTSRSMDRLVTIPMAPGVDSYSVNAAAAILLHHFIRK